jgi:hypothetical protein
MSVKETCELCGEPMPPGEEMFKFHGYSGPCPKPPLAKQPKRQWYAVTCHVGIPVATFADADAAARWAKDYFAANTPYAVRPIEEVDAGAW